MHKLTNGYVHIYTGNGKGKTTAAIGLAVRAAGFGLKSYLLMLMKEYDYSEIKSLSLLKELIHVHQICKDDFVLQRKPAPEEEKAKALAALNDARDKMLGGSFDLIIIDEICVAIYFGLITVEDVLPIIEQKPVNVELILTGRYCPQELIEKADLVTEMKEVKHYYQRGILSRRGIDS